MIYVYTFCFFGLSSDMTEILSANIRRQQNRLRRASSLDFHGVVANKNRSSTSFEKEKDKEWISPL